MANWSLVMVWDDESMGPIRVQSLAHAVKILMREAGISRKSSNRAKKHREQLQGVTIHRLSSK